MCVRAWTAGRAKSGEPRAGSERRGGDLRGGKRRPPFPDPSETATRTHIKRVRKRNTTKTLILYLVDTQEKSLVRFLEPHGTQTANLLNFEQLSPDLLLPRILLDLVQQTYGHRILFLKAEAAEREMLGQVGGS
ncbi:hypothetical protein EVAR_65443_1 [Eumeta japonica]|uniref:Uncharacterized protein n=1 Tax=Eumeta variegata TaxID=151549 RepID=A0A4C1ZGX7_EUMVA|nr:hypothetical protein EVAR_65443_1 [Eumeta japonica]